MTDSDDFEDEAFDASPSAVRCDGEATKDLDDPLSLH